MSEMLEVKKTLYEKAYQRVSDKLECNRTVLQDLKESAGSETKSSAGDKHETGRAMVHLEQEKMLKQQANNQSIQRVLDKIDPNLSLTTVALGSLVITDKVRFLVSAALGKTHFNGHDYYWVSLTSGYINVQ